MSREEIAPETVFVSHETYTPARGGSAAAEIHALRAGLRRRRRLDRDRQHQGHSPATRWASGSRTCSRSRRSRRASCRRSRTSATSTRSSGELNLSHGGAYPIRYALRLAAGFGSQISMILLRWTPVGRRPPPPRRRARLRLPDRRPADLDRVAAARERPGRPAARGRAPHRLRVVDGVPATAAPPPAAVPEPVVAAAEPVVAAERVAAAPSRWSRRPRRSSRRPRRWSRRPRRSSRRPSRSRGAGGARRATGWRRKVLAIVAEQTGYPADLLDMDLDLEADLGIDTVKQAEVFATIRETYGIERDDSLKLRDYPTLNHVVGFVHERDAAGRAGGARSAAPAPRRPSRCSRRRRPRRATGWRRRCWRSSPSRPATRRTCSTWTSTSRPIWGSTRSSRRRCSRRSARPTGSSATTRSSCATTRP